MNYFKSALLVLFFFFYGKASVWAEGIDYTVTINGIEDNQLYDSIQERSLLFKLADKKPETFAALDRRIKNDLKVFKAILKENGYYAATLNNSVEDKNNKQLITILIDKGPVYTISDFILRWPDDQSPDIDALSELQFPVGEPAIPDTMLDTEQEIITILMRNGFPFPQVNERKLIVMHESQSVQVELFFEPGVTANFGTTQITGLERVDQSFVERRIAWKHGEIFNSEKIAITRNDLRHSGVIASVDVNYGDISQNSDIPITLNIKERDHRSVGAGIAYSTTRELIGSVFWEHRNLLGQAENFRVRAEGGTATYGLGFDLNKPDIISNIDLSWQNSAELRRESVEAYDKDSASAVTSLHYNLSSTSAISGGLAIERSKIEEAGELDENFLLVSIPLTYRYDNTDEFLNPRNGSRLNLSLTPYQDLESQNSFIKNDAWASHYWPFGERFVWANRVRAAVIFGQSLEDIPADKRLYAGGGGSVRGYGYQLLGPLDENNNPTGGRMAFEVSTEGRFKITESIETVAFIEGGLVSQDLEINSNADVLWGIGTGVRYHTPIGPLRLDVAIPLDKREVDDGFQFYISLGQSF